MSDEFGDGTEDRYLVLDASALSADALHGLVEEFASRDGTDYGLTEKTLEEFADEHSATEVRRFNLLCMAYGANQEVFADVVDLGELPGFRAEICEEEFELIGLAYEALISPHVDSVMAEKVFERGWLSQMKPNTLSKDSQD